MPCTEHVSILELVIQAMNLVPGTSAIILVLGLADVARRIEN